MKKYYGVKNRGELEWLMQHFEDKDDNISWVEDIGRPTEGAGYIACYNEDDGGGLAICLDDDNELQYAHWDWYKNNWDAKDLTEVSDMIKQKRENKEEQAYYNEVTKYIKLDLQDLYGALDYNDVSGMMNSIYEVAEMGSFLWDYCFSGHKYPSELERFKHQVEVAQVAYDKMIEEKNTKYKVKVPGTANSYYYQSLSGNLQATDKEYEQHNFYFTQADLKHYGLDKDTFKKEKAEQCLAG